MAEIKFENVSKSFGKTTVIENMNLTLPDGKFTVLLGPSGCGKTTLLRMIAGIGPESSGTVYMNGKDLKNVPPGERNIAMVFQSYALYPTTDCLSEKFAHFQSDFFAISFPHCIKQITQSNFSSACPSAK